MMMKTKDHVIIGLVLLLTAIELFVFNQFFMTMAIIGGSASASTKRKTTATCDIHSPRTVRNRQMEQSGRVS
jgi:hypothetical protein